MKVQSLKTGIGSTIFILLIFAAFAVVRPVYNKLNVFVRTTVDSLRSEFEQQTGLTFSYSSLSPSILSAISLKGIVVSDLQNSQKILSVRSLTLSYNLKNLLSSRETDNSIEKNPQKLKGLTITGVKFDYDSEKSYSSLEKIRGFLRKAGTNGFASENNSGGRTIQLVKSEKASDLSAYLPDLIRIRDVSLHAVVEKQDFTVRAKEIQLTELPDGKSFAMDIKGAVEVKLSAQKRCSFNFNAHSNVTESFNDITSNLFLSNISTNDFKINSLNLLCEYAADENDENQNQLKKLHLKTLRNTFPFALDTTLDLNAKKADFSVSAKDFMPLQTVFFAHQTSLMKKLSRSSASFELTGSYNFESKKIEYTSSGNVLFPKQFIPGGMNAAYSVSGNRNSINVPLLHLSGRDYDISYSGSYSFKNMNLSGNAAINKIQLSNGGVISSELYFDPLPQGFMVFAPQLFLGEQSLTALQFSFIPRSDKSIDFNFEASDYSHLEAEEPGRIILAGSYLPDGKYIQSSLSVENLYLDSILKDIVFALPQNKTRGIEKTAQKISDFIFSGDAYISYDFETISFNIPYSIIANTKKDRQFVVFSLNGNNNSIQISQFDFLSGNQSVNLTGLAELTESGKEVFFSTDLNINSIPYHIGGTASSRWLDISGDYDLHSLISINENPNNIFEPSLSGTLHFENLPVSAKKYVFTSSLESTFALSQGEGFTSTISRFEVQEASGNLRTSPHLELTGNITKYGFIVDSLMMEDSVSLTNGKGNILWNINDGIFDSVNLDFEAESFLTGETWNLTAGFTNPLQKSFSLDSIKNDWYFSGSAEIQKFRTAHIMRNQSEEDTISLTAAASGTLENPYVQISILPSSVSLLGSPAMLKGNAVLEDNLLTLLGADLNWVLLHFSDINASYEIDTRNGFLDTNLDAILLSQNVHAPLKIKMDGISDKDSFSSFMVNVLSEKVEGSVFTTPFKLDLSILRTLDRFDIFSAGDVNINGYVLADGTVNMKTGAGFPIQSDISGYVHSDGFWLNFDSIYAELSDFSSLLTFDFIAVTNGTVTGNCVISGLASDPTFDGNISIAKPDFNLPIIIPEHFKGESLDLTIEDSEIKMPETVLHVAGIPAYTKLEINFDRWNFESLLIDVHTKPDQYVPADVNLGDIRIKGKGRPDLQILVTKDHADVSGFIEAKETSVVIKAKVLADAAMYAAALESGEKLNLNLATNYALNVSFDIMMGQGVQVMIDPIIRGVAQPGTPMHFSFDSTENMVSIDSDISFRGGELIYLNRNFYMREGRVVFSDRQELMMDPVITVRAETRERDSDGNQVTITLSATNQLMSMFSPRFTATPAKSETEIMELLGQVISADSTNAASLLLATGDYALQITVMRDIESALRDLFNFDIFSIRTMVLQNAMKQGLNMNNSSHKRTTAGNFFDNSTVYIGKYFSREIYADAMLQWVYDENRVNEDDTVSGLVFQPEFGLEMSSPYVNIRWGIAPDIDAIKENRWIPSTYVTLSWKFAF